MADVVEELTSLGRALVDAEHNSSDEIRRGLENARRFLLVVGEVLDMYDYKLNQDLTYAAGGNRKRAQQVTRPLRHASLLVLAANRRLKLVWTSFQRVFETELSQSRTRGKREQFEFGG